MPVKIHTQRHCSEADKLPIYTCMVLSVGEAKRLAGKSACKMTYSVPSETLRGYSIKESGFGYIVNPNLDSVKNCIPLTNLNPDSLNPA